MGHLKKLRLSTVVALVFVACGVIYLNTLPVWHYAGEQNGQELFEISGYGWPCEIYSTGLFNGPFREPSISVGAIACNIMFLVLVVGYAGLIAEWRRLDSVPLKRGIVWGTVLGLILGGLLFVSLCSIADMPVISPVSLSIVFKPWWQNWRSAIVVLLFVGTLVGVLQGLSSKFRPVKCERRCWWN